MNSTLRTCVLTSALASISAAQTTWYVDVHATPPGSGTSSDPYASIQHAITRPTTVSGDVVIVRPGTYEERIDFVGKELVVLGEAGAAATTIDAGRAGAVATFRTDEGPGARLQGFTLRNGSGRFIAMDGEARGGGIYCVHAQATIIDCAIVANATLNPALEVDGRGGGLYGGPGANVTLIGCTLAQNDATFGGGIALDHATLDVQGGFVIENRALGEFPHGARGGGLLVQVGAHALLQAVDVSSNVAVGMPSIVETLGGGIRVELGGSARIEGCTIAANDSGGFSLGYGDLAGYGGGVSSAALAHELTMLSSDVRDNWGNNGGGGIHGRATLDQCVIEGNHGQFGGGVAAHDVTLTGCVIRGNHGSVSGSYDWGAGVFVDAGSHALMQGCEIDSNVAFGLGGGGYGGTYVACDIHDNFASGDASTGQIGGGGVVGGDLVDCRLWRNRAVDFEYGTATGGALHGGTARRCVLYENEADSAGGAANATLESCTLVANEATRAAGGGVDGGSVHDTIVRFNVPDDVTPGTLASWSAVPAGVAGVGNVHADPLLWDVAAHDFRLRPGSPCIDAGDPTSPPDPDGSRADIGAIPFEPGPCENPIVYCTSKINSLGCVPWIGWSGAPSIGAGTFRVEGHTVINQTNGLLFWGKTKSAVPFLGGHLCVGPPIVRTAVQSSGGGASGEDCSGAFSFPWTSAYVAAQGLQAGDPIYCQYWSRDLADPFGSSLTNALSFTLCD